MMVFLKQRMLPKESTVQPRQNKISIIHASHIFHLSIHKKLRLMNCLILQNVRQPLCATIVNTKLTHEYFWNSNLKQEGKEKIGCLGLLEAILHYARIYYIHYIWQGTLINCVFSYLGISTTKIFFVLQSYSCVLGWLLCNTNLQRLDTAAFGFKNTGREMCRIISLEPEQY